MSITAGELRHLVRFYSEDEGTIETHGGIENPADPALLYTTWARIRPLSSREMYEASQLQSEVSHEIAIRYDSSFTPNPTMYIVFRGRRLDLEGARDMDERNEFYLISALEESRP